MRDQLELQGGKVDSMLSSLASLSETSGAVLKYMEAQPSKGPAKHIALCEVIRRLRQVFYDNYQGPHRARKRGSYQSLAPQEQRELDFVRCALIAARIFPKNTNRSQLQRLFRDPRCAVGQGGRDGSGGAERR